MKDKWKDIDVDLDFLKEDRHIEEVADTKARAQKIYKVIISDDDPEVHKITKMILKNFLFEGYSVHIIEAYNREETLKAFQEHPDAAVLFQDVVMEEKDTGLLLINYLRKEMNNQFMRIIIRTGQPGEAPEEKVIMEYDINDYWLKTELTVARLKTSLITALRSYRDIMKLENNRKGLEKIVEASANLFTHNSLTEFLTSFLYQLSRFYKNNESNVYIGDESYSLESNGFVTMNKCNSTVVVAATGSYKEYLGRDISLIEKLSPIYEWMNEHSENNMLINFIGDGIIVRSNESTGQKIYIFIEGKKENCDFELMKIFLSNYSIALDNYILNDMISTSQKEIILTLGEIGEKHFDETGSHVNRVSNMMYNFATHVGYSQSECEKIKLASILHDIGKIGIPDSVLKKKGKLTKEEFEIIKEHTQIGNDILSRSDMEILNIAAEIALNHHERYEGTGYPNGLEGEDIPLSARMLAIIDVYDAMSHKRVYKDAAKPEEALAYITEQKGKHFDGDLVDVFIKYNQSIILEVD